MTPSSFPSSGASNRPRAVHDTPQAFAASSLASPSAIFSQNARSTSRRIGGRPGDLIDGRPVRVTNHPGPLPIAHTSTIKVLRPPLESAQYLSIRYSRRLDDNNNVASVGSRGDSYDNALVESFNGLYKWELIYPKGPWKGLDDVEMATLTYVDWFNNHRRHGAITPGPSYTTPAAFEAAHYRQHLPTEMAGTQTNEPL